MSRVRPAWSWLKARLWGALGLACTLVCGKAPRASDTDRSPDPRPNILFILADDLGYGDLGCYGHPVIQTPNLDRLASEGVRLTQCYAASPNCSPARAALLTGRMPYRVGIYDFIRESYPLHIPPGETSVATLLRNAGYDTFLVGKWHLSGGQLDDERRKYPNPGDYGFETWLANRRSFGVDPTTLVRNGRPAGPMRGFPAQIVIRETLQWLEHGRDPDKPFCAFVWLHEPHEPVKADPRFQAPYAELHGPIEGLGLGGPSTDRSAADPALRQRYFGAVTMMDHELGRLFDRLDALGLAKNTFVFFTSDNGPESRLPTSWGSPGVLRGAKGQVWEGGIRVPGIARWPGRIPAGSECDVPINGTDLLPTLCAVAGIPPRTAKPLDGVNALPALEHCTPLHRDIPMFWWLFHARGGMQVAMRVGEYKMLARMKHPEQPTTKDLLPPPGVGLMDFIKNTPIEAFELYDVVRDPTESHELSSERPEVFRSMRRRMLELYEEIRKEGPVWGAEGIIPPPQSEN